MEVVQMNDIGIKLLGFFDEPFGSMARIEAVPISQPAEQTMRVHAGLRTHVKAGDIFRRASASISDEAGMPVFCQHMGNIGGDAAGTAVSANRIDLKNFQSNTQFKKS